MRRTHARWTSALMLSTLAATGIAFVGRGAEAQESKDVVSVQARILQNGVPVNADLNLTFEIYTTSSGGGPPLWTESQTAVPVRNGVVAISLGMASALGSTFKNGFSGTSERWLAIKETGGGEIVPRIRLTAVPYAQAAEVASAIWNSSTSTSLTLSALVGTGLEQDGTGRIRIASSAAGNGLTGGSGSALAVNPGALINGGAAAVDADRLRIDLTTSLNYTPDASGSGGLATATTDLTAHLKGISNALAGGGGGGGGVVPRSLQGGRLTADNSNPILPAPTADVMSTSIGYFPHSSDQVALYDGSSTWNVCRIPSTGLSASVTSLATDTNHDVFVYDNSGGSDTLASGALALQPWTSNSARNASHLLTRIDGVWVKSSDTTRRYLGTIRTFTDGGTVKVFDKARYRFVWNADNRILRSSHLNETAATWTGSGAWRICNANATAWQIFFVVGLSHEDAITAGARCYSVSTGGTNAGWIGVGYDSTSAPSSSTNLTNWSGNTSADSEYVVQPVQGYHYVAGLELANTGTQMRGYHAFGGPGYSHMILVIRN